VFLAVGMMQPEEEEDPFMAGDPLIHVKEIL
jgi:hypothetical protein